MTHIIVFDVNETLLDLAPVRGWFADRFDENPSASAWFSELLRLSFVSSVVDRYVPFTELAAAALGTVAARCRARIDDDDLATVRSLLTTLPAHSDVPSGLDRLRSSGFTLAALTNSPQSTAETQLANAGIDDRFDAIMSVDMVRRFKPHRSVVSDSGRASRDRAIEPRHGRCTRLGHCRSDRRRDRWRVHREARPDIQLIVHGTDDRRARHRSRSGNDRRALLVKPNSWCGAVTHRTPGHR